MCITSYHGGQFIHWHGLQGVVEIFGTECTVADAYHSPRVQHALAVESIGRIPHCCARKQERLHHSPAFGDIWDTCLFQTCLLHNYIG